MSPRNLCVMTISLLAMGCDGAADDAAFRGPSPSSYPVMEAPEVSQAIAEARSTDSEPIDMPAEVAEEQTTRPSSPAASSTLGDVEERAGEGASIAAEEDIRDTQDEEEVEEQSAAPAEVEDIFDGASEPVLWSPNSTMKFPSYGQGCRYTAGQVIQSATNGEVDDSMFFELSQAGDGALEMEVLNDAGKVMSAQVSLKRALPGRSFRQANGTITWTTHDGEQTANIVDGTLCFDSALGSSADDTLVEFSFILEHEGVYRAIGGNTLLDGQFVGSKNSAGLTAPSALDIDLR